MNVNSKVKDTLSPIGYDVEFGTYKGTADKYFTFNYADDRAELYGDGEPIYDIAYLQIHFFAPKTFNHMTIKQQTRSKLFKAGFSYPSVQTFEEDDTGKFHLVFECSIDGESDTEED